MQVSGGAVEVAQPLASPQPPLGGGEGQEEGHFQAGGQEGQGGVLEMPYPLTDSEGEDSDDPLTDTEGEESDYDHPSISGQVEEARRRGRSRVAGRRGFLEDWRRNFMDESEEEDKVEAPALLTIAGIGLQGAGETEAERGEAQQSERPEDHETAHGVQQQAQDEQEATGAEATTPGREAVTGAGQRTGPDGAQGGGLQQEMVDVFLSGEDQGRVRANEVLLAQEQPPILRQVDTFERLGGEVLREQQLTDAEANLILAMPPELLETETIFLLNQCQGVRDTWVNFTPHHRRTAAARRRHAAAGGRRQGRGTGGGRGALSY